MSGANPSKVLAGILGFVLSLLTCWTAAAQEDVVGFVKTITSDAYLERDGTPLAPQVGDPVQHSDVVIVGEGGSLGITFIDNTMLSFGPNTRFILEEYRFLPLQQEFSFIGRVFRGSFVYISGEIGRLAADGVMMITPTGIIGIRGTRFAGAADEE